MTAAAKESARSKPFSVVIRLTPEAIAAIDQAKANVERREGYAISDQSIGEAGFRSFCERNQVRWPDAPRNLRRVIVRAVRRTRAS